MATSPAHARRNGIIAVAVAAAAFIGWEVMPEHGADRSVTVAVLTTRVGTGIETGSDVRADGVRIGTVAELATAGTGRQRLTLRLDRSGLDGLTDSLSLDYAPANLFGISEIELRPGVGGKPLAQTALLDLTGDNGARTTDATLSTVLRSLGQLTHDVLTSQLITVLQQIATDTQAFAPLFRAVVAIVQSIADTQRLPSAYLLEQYGNTLTGLPPTVRGLVDVLNGAFSNAYLNQEGKIAKFDAGVNMIKDDLLGALVRVLDAGDAHYSGITAALTPVLTALAATVPDPARASTDLTTLLRRLDAAMPDTPDGPVLNVAVDLTGVPGLAVPLSALLSPAPAPAASEAGR